MIDCEFNRSALVVGEIESRRNRHGLSGNNCVYLCRVGQHREMRAGVTQFVEDGLTHAHFTRQRLKILRRFGSCGENRHMPGPIGDGTEQTIETGGGDMPGFQRQHLGGDAIANRCERGKLFAAIGCIVDQHDRCRTLAFCGNAVGVQQGFQLRTAIRRARELVGHRTGRADRRARAAAHAQVGIDLDDIAGRRNRCRRTDIDALVATGFFRSAVRANRFFVREVSRLAEFADHLRQFGDGLIERLRIGGVKIALRGKVHRERWFAAQIEHQIERRDLRGTVFRLERRLKCAEIPAERQQLTAHNFGILMDWRCFGCRPEHCHRELAFEGIDGLRAARRIGQHQQHAL